MRRTLCCIGMLCSLNVFAQATGADAAPAQPAGSATPAPADAQAQGETPPPPTGEDAAEDPMLPPQPVVATVPTQGTPLKVRRGFFTETNIGTFFTLGGNDVYSNAQSYLQLGVGYDLFEFLELGVHVGFGANAFNCFSGRIDGVCPTTDAFTVTFVDGSLAYRHFLADRFYLVPRFVGGYTLLDPAPVANVFSGPNFGLGIGVEYATSMDHFSIGADFIGRYVLRANIPAFSVMPRVKYTF